MLLKNKEIAFIGIMMAFAVLLQTLGGYLESSTLFFLAAASFLTGIIERNFSVAVSVVFLAGSALLGFFLAPQKAYIGTFVMFSVYVIVAEFFEKKVFLQEEKKSPVFEWGIKGLIYHVFLFLTIFFIWKLFGFEDMAKNKVIAVLFEHKALLFPVFLLAAEALWILFDRAYIFFMRNYSRYFKADRYL
ncbi:MAG: hypothetical protein IJ733_01055 [Lachnospiraceae bacterium]|nr:hypothetical protein [Lachnospiraceae bacterium]